MKRLIVSSLLGCMLMGQMNASDLRNQIVTGVTNALSEVGTKAGAMDFAKGAGMASLALLVPRTIVMFDSAQKERDYLYKRCGTTSLHWLTYPSYLRPSKNLIGYHWAHEDDPSDDELKAADNRNINWNRIAAIFSTLFFGASVAKLCGWQGMPTFATSLLGSKLTTAGIATGSAVSLGLLLPNLKKL